MHIWKMMMTMMVLCTKAGSLAFTPPGEEMSGMVLCCLPHRQLWVSNLSTVTTQWLEVDLNLQPFSCKAHNTPLHHRVPSLADALYNNNTECNIKLDEINQNVTADHQPSQTPVDLC